MSDEPVPKGATVHTGVVTGAVTSSRRATPRRPCHLSVRVWLFQAAVGFVTARPRPRANRPACTVRCRRCISRRILRSSNVSKWLTSRLADRLLCLQNLAVCRTASDLTLPCLDQLTTSGGAHRRGTCNRETVTGIIIRPVLPSAALDPCRPMRFILYLLHMVRKFERNLYPPCPTTGGTMQEWFCRTCLSPPRVRTWTFLRMSSARSRGRS